RRVSRKKWIAVASILALFAVVIGRQFDLFSLVAEYYATATHISIKTKPEISQHALKPKLSEEEHQRQKSIKAHLDNKGRFVFAPTAVAEMQIDPKLVKGIPWEAQYKPVPLSHVEVTYTEDQFQKDRADWYQNLFLAEYEQNGRRNPKWDDLVNEFLKEAARRVSITRFRSHRSIKYYADKLDDQFAEQGKAIINLGCNDPLVMSLFLEELMRQKNSEFRNYAKKLEPLYDPARNSEIINFQILKMLLRCGQGIKKREEMTRHYREAINNRQLSSLERRIYLEEADIILAPAHRTILGQFIVSLENQDKADPWLKNMLLGTFYNELGLHGGTLREFWPAYPTVIHSNWENVRSVFMGHLRKSYRLYLQAYQIAPELPEAPLRLFGMSFRQNPVMVDIQMEENGIFDRLSPASPRYWFDQAVAAQFDFRPMYRLYRGSVIPQKTIYDRLELYQPVVNFGLECLNTERFDTQVPFGFHEALQTIIAKHEYSRGPNSPRNREVYGLENMLSPMKQMVEGYSSHFTEDEKIYYESLLAGMNWIQGQETVARKQFSQLDSRLDLAAIKELYLDLMEVQRSISDRKDNVLLTVDLEELKGIGILPDRPHLMFLLTGGRIRIWDLEKHQTVKEYSLISDVDDDTPIPQSFSENVKFVSYYRHPEVKIFETSSFSEVASLTLPELVKLHRISNTGKYVLVALAEQVELWEVATQTKVAEINIHADETRVDIYDWRDMIQHVREVHFSADDSQVAFVRGNIFKKFPQGYWSPGFLPHVVDLLYVWDLNQKKLIYEGKPFHPNINAMRFTNSGKELLVSGTKWSLAKKNSSSRPETKETHSIKLLNYREAKTVREYAGRNKPLWVPAKYGQDQSQLIAMAGGELQVWDRETGQELTSLRQHPGDVRHLLSSNQGDQLVSIDAKGSLKIYSTPLIPNVRRIDVEPDFYENQAPHRIEFHTKSKQMAVCNSNTGGVIWDFSDPQHAIGRTFRASGPVGTTALDFSPDLKLLATTADTMPGDVLRELQEKAPVSIWDTTTGEIIRVLEGETSLVVSGRFDPTGRFIAVGSKDGNIIIWDLESKSNKPMQILKDHVAAVTELKFSSDGKFLVSGGQRGESFGKKLMPSIKIWSVTGQMHEYNLTRTLKLNRRSPHPFGVQDIDLSTDGKWILASYGVQTSLFSFEGELRCSVQGTQARFSPDGSKFITAGGVQLNKIVAMWNFDGQKIKQYVSGNRRPISVLSLFPGKDIFLSGSYSEGVAGWQSETGERIVFLADLFR
ncbi:MAG: WD40 repeat domain-containing protein, partial [Gimesia sp.]